VSIDGTAARRGYEPFPPFAAWLAVPYDATIFRRQEPGWKSAGQSRGGGPGRRGSPRDAHYCYVCVHPFADDNGRVARALASVFLYRRPGVPLVVFADQRALHLDAIEAADAGRPEAFTAFVDERVADTIGVLLANIRAPGPTVTASLDVLRSTHAAVVGSGDLDRDAVRVATVVDEAFSAALAKLDGSPVVATFMRSPGEFGWTDAVRDGFRVVADAGGRFFLHVRMDLGSPATVAVWGAVFVSTTYRAGVDLLIASQADPEGVEVARREVDPVVTESLRRKVEGWVEGQLESALQQLAGQTTGRP